MKLKSLFDNLGTTFGADIPEDENMVMERCEKGTCLKKLKKKNLPKLYKNLLEVKSRFGGLTVASSLIGEAKTLPGSSCSIIKKVANINVSGFYWIKNHCAMEPSKV